MLTHLTELLQVGGGIVAMVGRKPCLCCPLCTLPTGRLRAACTCAQHRWWMPGTLQEPCVGIGLREQP
eukprot:1159293-Pelagomonas_calceolata.AAC.5